MARHDTNLNYINSVYSFSTETDINVNDTTAPSRAGQVLALNLYATLMQSNFEGHNRPITVQWGERFPPALSEFPCFPSSLCGCVCACV